MAAEQWLDRFALADPTQESSLRSIYGVDRDIILERVNLFGTVLATFCHAFGARQPVFLVRCPSRVNWEGHHVDHQGGSYNATTQAREFVAACSERQDGWVIVHNAESLRFRPCRFRVDDLSPQHHRSGGWERFVIGAWIALKERFPTLVFHGVNLALGSDIPTGGGMSSSHALLVTSLLAAATANRLTLQRSEIVSLIQRADWLAGSRTGLGDQATMLFGRRGFLFHSPVGTADEISPEYIPLPDGYALMIADSLTHHTLAGQEAVAYNSRVFACRLALPLLLQGFAALGIDETTIASLRCPADISPQKVPLELIYQGLGAIPSDLRLDEARLRFQEACVSGLTSLSFDELVETYFPSGERPDTVPVRGVLMYTLAECRRSVLFAQLLLEGNISEAGRLMNAGHEGDRVSRANPETGEYTNAEYPVTDILLKDLLDDLRSQEPNRTDRAQLQYQHGDYRASTPTLDQMVDIARTHGAVGASLTGGGHGGVMIALMQEDRCDGFREAMCFFHRERSCLSEDQASRTVQKCVTVEGAGMISI